MAKFAKLFEADGDQFLVWRRYNQDDDVYQLVLTTIIDGIEMTQTASYEDEEAVVEMFDKYSQKDAEETLVGLRKLLV